MNTEFTDAQVQAHIDGQEALLGKNSPTVKMLREYQMVREGGQQAETCTHEWMYLITKGRYCLKCNLKEPNWMPAPEQAREIDDLACAEKLAGRVIDQAFILSGNGAEVVAAALLHVVTAIRKRDSR